jgi:hypothetical protein
MNIWNDWDGVPDDAGDADAIPGASFPDPWDDPHDIEYWVWDGKRLVPASPTEQSAIQEAERGQSARRRLTQWEREQREAAQPARGLAGVREAIARVWHLWRRDTRPATSSLETHQTALSPHQPSGER